MFRFLASPGPKPRIAVLGGFTLSPALQHRQEAQLIETLISAGHEADAVTLTPGGFPLTHLRSTEPADRAILFLRCFANTPRGPQKWSARWADWRRLSRFVGATRRSVILFDRPWRSKSGALQAVAALALKLRHPLSVRLRLNGPPVEVLLSVAGLGAIDIVGPEAAQNRLFLRLLRSNPTGLPLTEALVDRALAETGDTDLRISLRELCHHAAQVQRHLVKDALARVRMNDSDNTPMAIHAALEDDGGEPRLIRHLRKLTLGAALPREYQTSAQQAATGPTADLVRFIETGNCPTAGHAAWLSALLAPGKSPLTRFEWLMALVLQMPVQTATAFRQPWSVDDWRRQLHKLLPGDHPGFGESSAPSPAVTLHGDSQSQTGLGLNMQMSLTALRQTGLPCTLSGGATFAGARLLRRPAALYHLNADRVPQEMVEHYRFAETYHIGFALWELNRLPQAHRLALDMLDEIWAPSVFVAKAYRQEFRGKVMLMRKGLPQLDPQPRLPKPGVTRFVMAFDEHSSVCRKNPLAAVRAFQAAFGPRKDVELVIKTSPAPDGHWGDPEEQMAQIIRAAAIDRRIRLIREHWPMNGLMGLVRGASALVSPHRAEGFGYLPAFALQMGVPVITTDWSGTRDFCTEETAYPVPCELVPVGDGQTIHPTPGARWADIDVGALAETMRAVADNPDAARRRAAMGAQRLALDYSMEAQARRYAERLTALGILMPEQEVDPAALDAMFAKCS